MRKDGSEQRRVSAGPERDEVLKEAASWHVIRLINHQGKAFVRRFGQGFTCRPEAQKRVGPLSQGMGPLQRAESQLRDRVPRAARAKGLDIHPNRMTAADDASQPAARMGDREEGGSAPANIHGNRAAMGIMPKCPALWARAGQRAQDGPDQRTRQAAVVPTNGAHVIRESPSPERGARKRGDAKDRAIDGPARPAAGT